MRNVLRCQRDMGFWTYFSCAADGEVGTLYCRLCSEEYDLQGRYTVTWSNAGVRKDVFKAWNWCSCHGGCCVCDVAVRSSQEVTRRPAVSATQSEFAPLGKILAAATEKAGRS